MKEPKKDILSSFIKYLKSRIQTMKEDFKSLFRKELIEEQKSYLKPIQWRKQKLLPSLKQRNRGYKMSLDEQLTVVIMYHSSYAKNFKYFYKTCIEYIHKDDFPNALSYNRFIALMPRLFMPLNILVHTLLGKTTVTYFIDTTPIKVCNNKRQSGNKIFKGLAKYSKSTKSD
jgi:hypothetical protein